jgi:hypothetical protein
MRARLVPVALPLLAALIAGGCGELGASWRGTRTVRPRVVPTAEVARYAADTPQRAFLAWFRALQLGDPAAAIFYDKTLRMSPGRIAHLRKGTASALFKEVGAPEVLDVSRDGHRATVFTLLTARRAAPNGRVDSYVTPQAFNLVRTGGSWRVADNRFLETADALHRDFVGKFAGLGGV